MKYKITTRRERMGRIIEEVEEIIEAPIKPKVGQGFTQCCNPPIYNTIIKVEEVND